MPRRWQRNRYGTRSSIYSESRFANWGRFAPHVTEFLGFQRNPGRPAEIAHRDAIEVPIYERQLHEDFVRPYTARDVRRVIERFPGRYLNELEGIVLLGGSEKQDRVSLGPRFHFGSYRSGWIALNAYPKKRLHFKSSVPPEAALGRHYPFRFSSRHICRIERGWELHIPLDVIRRFYLEDVLIHELGHHVDRFRVYRRSYSDVEYVACAFRNRHGRK